MKPAITGHHEVRAVDAPAGWNPVIQHLQLEASPAAEAAAPEPALTGVPATQLNHLPGSLARPKPGQRTPAPDPR